MKTNKEKHYAELVAAAEEALTVIMSQNDGNVLMRLANVMEKIKPGIVDRIRAEIEVEQGK